MPPIEGPLVTPGGRLCAETDAQAHTAIARMKSFRFIAEIDYTAMPSRLALVLALTGGCLYAQPAAQRPRLSVKPTQDFEVTGKGDNAAWEKAEWTALRRREPANHQYDARFKALYST